MVVGLGFGMVENGEQSKKLAKLLDVRSPEDAEVQGLIRRILLAARFDAVLLLFIVFDMTARPWS